MTIILIEFHLVVIYLLSIQSKTNYKDAMSVRKTLLKQGTRQLISSSDDDDDDDDENKIMTASVV